MTRRCREPYGGVCQLSAKKIMADEAWDIRISLHRGQEVAAERAKRKTAGTCRSQPVHLWASSDHGPDYSDGCWPELFPFECGGRCQPDDSVSRGRWPGTIPLWQRMGEAEGGEPLPVSHMAGLMALGSLMAAFSFLPTYALSLGAEGGSDVQVPTPWPSSMNPPALRLLVQMLWHFLG